MTASIPHRIIAIIMALLMFITSTGFSMDAHYCQNKLKGVSFLGEAKSCHKAKATCHNATKSCHAAPKVSQEEKNDCCHNQSIVVEKSDIDATPQQVGALQTDQLHFIAAFVAVYLFNISVDSDLNSTHPYKPPIPDKDIQVLYQTFLM